MDAGHGLRDLCHDAGQVEVAGRIYAAYACSSKFISVFFGNDPAHNHRETAKTGFFEAIQNVDDEHRM